MPEQQVEIELRKTIEKRVGGFVLELRLEQIFHLDIGMCDSVGDAQGVVENLNGEFADLVRRKDDVNLIELARGVLVDREQDALVIEVLSAVLV